MTTNPDLVAGDPELAPLWAVIHHRLCAGHQPASIASVSVPGMSPGGVATLRSWLDTSTRRRRGRSAVVTSASGVSVPVRELLRVLGIGPGQLLPFVERAARAHAMSRAGARGDAAGLRQELRAYAAGELPGPPVLFRENNVVLGGLIAE